MKLRHALSLGMLVAVSFALAQQVPVPPPLLPEFESGKSEKIDLELSKQSNPQNRRQVFGLMTGRWHLRAKMTRAGTDRTLEYEGVMVGRFIPGTSFFQMETETFLANGEKISSTSIQIYDSGSETYRMIENLGDKILVEMVGRVSGEEIIWRPMHGISYEVAENVIRFVNPDLMESRTELQEHLDSPKIVVVTTFTRVKDDFVPGSSPVKPSPPLTPLPPALEKASKTPEVTK